MANFRACRETFLHYLADNLPDITFHYIHYEKDNEAANQLQSNAVNITFHDAKANGAGDVSEQLVTLDIVNDSEIDAIDQEEQIITLLQKACITPLMDYSGVSSDPPTAAAALGSEKLYWDTQVSFQTVAAPSYFHRSALIKLALHYL